MCIRDTNLVLRVTGDLGISAFACAVFIHTMLANDAASLALSGQQPVLVFQQWQFKPIMDNGRPRPYRALLIFKF
jgi:hypothetical protein